MGLHLPASPERLSLSNRLNAAKRHHPDQDTTELRRELGFFIASDAIQFVLDHFPPLNEDQEHKLCALLRAPRAKGEAA